MPANKSLREQASMHAADAFAARVNHSLRRQGADLEVSAATRLTLTRAGAFREISLATAEQVYEASPGGTWTSADLVAAALLEGDLSVL